MLQNSIPVDWRRQLSGELEKQYFVDLQRFLSSEKTAEQTVYPTDSDIFSALVKTPFAQTRVVVLGQDPYHGAGQAMGLAFSVPRGERVPPSLRNIYKELSAELPNFVPPTDGDLTAWAAQGVLLLNSVLTVRAGAAASHARQGWEQLTDAMIARLSSEREGLVFVLWGKYAQRKGAQIDTTRHLVLTAGHPSPLSVRYFRGCGHFTAINQYLRERGEREIEWQL